MSAVDRNSGILSPQERFSEGERREYQEAFLRDIVQHSYNSGTPLKEAMDARGLTPGDIRSVEDVQKLPIIKKTDLVTEQKKNPPFGGFCTVKPGELSRIHQSPGPINDPGGRVPDYWRGKVALYAAGFRPGDIVVNTFAYHLTPAGHMFEEGLVELGATVIPTGVGNTETQVNVFKDLGVTGYVGTPSFLNTILKRAEEMGLNPRSAFKLEVAYLLAEMVPESMRRKFLDDYGIIGRQGYGTADVGMLSYECPACAGMHIHYDVILEIVDPATGKKLPAGEPGEVVVTTNNRIYPLVRFGTGDVSSLALDECTCGRTGPRLTRIMGRVDQVTKVKAMFVHPSQVEKVIERHPEIAKGRLLVERPADADVMTLEIELKTPAPEGFVAAVQRTIQEIVKLKGGVKILEPGTLPEGYKMIEDVRKWD